jgi:sulfite reductase beta subunit-like hemoprotein
MIGSLSLSLFRECCGKFVAQIRNLDPGHDSTWCLERESKLHQLGYNVEAGKLTSAQRQDILIQILETKQLSFFEIVNTIEQNIRIFDSHSTKQVAVEKWRTDLKFINEYVANKNPLS